MTTADNIGNNSKTADATQINAIAAPEAKLFRINEKLKFAEEKISELTIENTQINTLKDTLRERNNSIKDLKRNLDDRERNKKTAPEDSDELRLRIVDLMAENKTLKQALAAATVGSRQGSADRIGK